MARISFEGRDSQADLRRMLDLLSQVPAAASECVPPMDVIEAADNLHIVLDLPGVPVNDIQITLSDGDLAIGGRKSPGTCQHPEAAFHLAERAFGRFARTLRLNGAFDAGRITATLSEGELRIVLPRVQERRGQPLIIPITVLNRG